MFRYLALVLLMGCGPLPRPGVGGASQKTVTPIVVAEENRLSFIREDGARWARLVDEEPSGVEVLDTMPAWSKTGTIAFASSRGGKGLADLSIWIIRATDEAPFRLTDGAGIDLLPAWSPTGEAIAFASSRGKTGYDVWMVSLATKPDGTLVAGTPTQVTRDAGHALDPAWSPDGKSIVYSLQENGVRRLRIASLSGQPSRDVTVGPNDQSPIFHPDGKRIIYSGVDTAGADLMVTDRNGTSSVAVVTDATGHETRPVLSHTGRFLFATSTVDVIVELEKAGTRSVSFQSLVFVDLKAPPNERALRVLFGGTVSRSGVALAPIKLNADKLLAAPLYREALPAVLKQRLGTP